VGGASVLLDAATLEWLFADLDLGGWEDGLTIEAWVKL